RRVARPAAGDPHVKVAAMHPADAVQNLEHRIAVAVAAIGDEAAPAPTQALQRQPVGGGEIADMDIVADTGAVRRRIVGAEYLDEGPLAERGLAGDLDQMRRAFGRLAGAALRIG